MLWRFDTLKFESGVFGAPVGRVKLTKGKGVALGALLVQKAAQGIWLVSARIRADDALAVEDLQVCGFAPIETLVTLERPVCPATAMPEHVRPAKPTDRADCLKIARTAFVHDRFHVDGRVAEALADAYKETWVANALDGRADCVLVAETSTRIAGFVTCMWDGDVAVIDLIAVAEAQQGKGIGKDLIVGMIAHYKDRARCIRVGTQEDNTPSLSLYVSQGFQPVSRHKTFHRVNAEFAP